MTLPNRDNVRIDRSKLVDYLLSETHAVGRSKAKFLRAVGFDMLNVDDLEKELVAIARSQDVQEVASSRHGVKYVIDGTLHTPSGGVAYVRTIWIVDAGGEYPRFVTAYPLRPGS